MGSGMQRPRPADRVAVPESWGCGGAPAAGRRPGRWPPGSPTPSPARPAWRHLEEEGRAEGAAASRGSAATAAGPATPPPPLPSGQRPRPCPPASTRRDVAAPLTRAQPHAPIHGGAAGAERGGRSLPLASPLPPARAHGGAEGPKRPRRRNGRVGLGMVAVGPARERLLLARPPLGEETPPREGKAVLLLGHPLVRGKGREGTWA